MDPLMNLVDKLNLPFEGKYYDDGDDFYEIRLHNSDDFSEVYNLISNLEDFTNDDPPTATTNVTSFIFNNGEYNIKLDANYNKDLYLITIERR